MFQFFSCEVLTPQDAVFLMDRPESIANNMGTLTFESYDAEVMKKYLLSKITNVHRFRSKLSKIFGIWWFERMS
jgi:hypothetical protein